MSKVWRGDKHLIAQNSEIQNFGYQNFVVSFTVTEFHIIK